MGAKGKFPFTETLERTSWIAVSGRKEGTPTPLSVDTRLLQCGVGEYRTTKQC